MTVSRRRFLKRSALAGASLALPVGTALGAVGANDRIRIAVVGVGGRGKEHIQGFGKQVVALCDVDQQFLDLRAGEFKQQHGTHVDKYTDYRKLLDDQSIDAIAIATPNHTHSLIAIAAIQAGKDVYVEKPVSHNVWEGRQLVNAARQNDRIVQCGTQLRSSPSVTAAVTFVQEGNLGKILYAIGTCYKPRESIGKSNTPLQFPSSVDRDLWVGPAADVPIYRPEKNSKGNYNPHYDWHWDFNTGCGDVGNQGIHEMDVARWFLGEDALAPRTMSIGGRFGYDDAGNTPNTQIVYHDYGRAPLLFETRGLPKSKAGQKDWGNSMDNYRGSSIGVIVQCEQGHVLIPNYVQATAFDNDGEIVEEWFGEGNHFLNFLEAVRSHKVSDLNADILEGHLSSALCHTGNISHRLGTKVPAKVVQREVESNELAADSFQRMASHLHANEVDIQSSAITLGPWLEMDPASERFTNNDQANELLTRDYRKPFIVPDLSS